MTPHGGGRPERGLADAIGESFGAFDGLMNWEDVALRLHSVRTLDLVL